ncbi:MAG: hypothetical protein OEN22_00255 [Gammaproteobacteria bacterium]|nr:hypothetical protein [Gammaproteobacteria bacterium]
MKTISPVNTALFFGGFLLFGAYLQANAQGCTAPIPCTMTLYMLPGSTSGAPPSHLEYGDKLVLSFDGNKTVLIPDVADWESGSINLKPVEVWKPGALPGEGRIVLVWEFKVKSKNDPHVPSDKQHLNMHLYKNPDSGGDDWILDGTIHSDGGIHGGTAHMTQ